MAGPYSIGSAVWPGLSKVVEECGEVTQVLGKLIGAGGDVNHFDGSNLASRIEEELGDLTAAIEFFLGADPTFNSAKVSKRRREKLALFWKWHREAQASGSRDEPAVGATAALAIDYTSPNAPRGWYVIYTNADGRRELAHDACFREDQANAAQKARIMGPGFSPLYWSGEDWMPLPAAPDAAALVEGE